MPVTTKANQTTQKTHHEAKKVRATSTVNTRDTLLTLDAVNAAADLSTEHILAAQRQVGNRATYDIIRRRSSVGLEGSELDAPLSRQIQTARGGGFALDKSISARMAPALGANLSRVRVHSDRHADMLSRSLNATAFTLGSDMFFSDGAYQPGSSQGRQLIAHELTHVVQQGGATGNKVRPKLAVGPTDDRYEREADRVAQTALRSADHGASPQIQRWSSPLKKKKTIEAEQYSRLPATGGQNANDYINALLANPQMLSPKEKEFVKQAPQTLSVKQNPNKLPTTGTNEGAEKYKEALRADPSLLSEKERQLVKSAPNVLGANKPSDYLAPEKKPLPKPPVITGPQAPAPSDDPAGQQKDAENRGVEAYSKAMSIAAQGKVKAEAIKKQNAPSPEEIAIRKSKIGLAKDASKRAQKSEAGATRSVGRTGDQFENLVNSVQNMTMDINSNGIVVARHLKAGNKPDAQQYATISVQLAKSAEKRVTDAEGILAKMEETANVDAAAARAGIDKAYDKDKEKPRDWAGVEKSASDAVVAHDQNKHKIERYLSYLSMDAMVVKGLVVNKITDAAQMFGDYKPPRIVAAGRARANINSHSGPLSEELALKVIGDPGDDITKQDAAEHGSEFGEAQAEVEKPKQETPAESKGNKYLNPSLKEGKWAGFKNKMGAGLEALPGKIKGGFASAGGVIAKPFKAVGRLLDRKVFRRDRGKEIAKRRMVQGLEFMAKVQAESEERQANAEKWNTEAELLQAKALETYDKIDLDKKAAELNGTNKPGQADPKLNSAILQVGQSWKDVAKGALYRDKLKTYRDDVAAESDKYAKYGKRAAGNAKKIGMTMLGLLTGTGLSMFTGGMIRFEKKEVAGGYSVTMQKKTIIDDLIQAYKDLKEAANLKGIGGKWGARIYAVLQGTSIFLGFVRTLCSSVALWLSLTGVSAPVAGGFASAALYAAIAKAAIDLGLMIWAAIGSKMTMDPRMRTKLRGRIARHGLEFGEGAATVATAGMMSGITGSPGAFAGVIAPDVFNTEGMSKVSMGYLGYTGANQAIKQSIGVTEKVGAMIGEGVNDENVRANKMRLDKADQPKKEVKEQDKESTDKWATAKKEISAKWASFKTKISDGAESALKAISGRATSKEKKERYEEVMAILRGVPQHVQNVGQHTQQLPEEV